jgi:hypothetical protein
MTQLELFPGFEPKPLPQERQPSGPPAGTLAAVHSQDSDIVEALANLGIRVPLIARESSRSSAVLLPKLGTQKPMRCPKCFPTGTETKRTDLIVKVGVNEALFRCSRCQWSSRLTVGRQP